MSNEDFLIYNQEILNDEPVELFPNLIIYPIIMKSYILFLLTSSILKIEKNKVNDPKIISMSYLDYLIYLIEGNSQDYNPDILKSLLCMLIDLVTKTENSQISYRKIKGKTHIIINGVELNKGEFDKLRYFILYQNIPDYKEEYINPELEKELELANEIKNRGKTPCSIEKQEMAVVIGSSLTLEDVRNLTIRKFFIALEMIDKKMNYVMQKTASLSGFVEFKEEITHYLIEKKHTINDDVIDYQQFKNKISV